MNSGERVRDYKREYKVRQERNKRLHADLEREKVDRFQKYLRSTNQTFVKWLNKQIDDELKKT